VALWRGPLSSPDGEVGVHHVDQLIETAFVREWFPAVTLVERQTIATAAEWGDAEARIGTELIQPTHDDMLAAGLGREATRRFALVEQRLDGGCERQPGHLWVTLGWGHARQCATHALAAGRVDLTDQSTQTYRHRPVAGYGRQFRRLCMPGPATALELTADERHQLSGWVRAGTTPQRLARRARLILGSAAGLGSRALARQERMSRTTVRRWLGRFATQRCAGLRDRPGRGRPKTLTPATRALVVALACERPAEREVPLRRYSLSELTVEVAKRLPRDQVAPSQTAIWRVLAHDALRPWRYRSWITPRDPHFLERAGPVLDLYACQWQGRPLWADEYVLSADEKTSIQVRRRLHPTVPIGPHQAMRVEHEYERAGVVQYLAAWDVHRAVAFGRCEPKTGKSAFADWSTT
jgi:transposase